MRECLGGLYRENYECENLLPMTFPLLFIQMLLFSCFVIWVIDT